MENDEEEKPELAYCEIIDEEIPRNHPYFLYDAEMKLAEAEMGLSIGEGVRLQATRELLDMLDTLYNMIKEPEARLPDNQRKSLNHADEVWLDLKEKMSQGDKRSAHLLSSHAHIELALGHLLDLRGDEKFKEVVPDYLIKYLGKLSTFVYREAIGHVML